MPAGVRNPYPYPDTLEYGYFLETKIILKLFYPLVHLKPEIFFKTLDN